MSGTGAVTSPAFVHPASNPHRPLLPVWILLGNTFHLGQRVTCITQCWLREDGKRKQEAKDLIRNMQTEQITHVGTFCSCLHSPALPELPSIMPASCSGKTVILHRCLIASASSFLSTAFYTWINKITVVKAERGNLCI